MGPLDLFQDIWPHIAVVLTIFVAAISGVQYKLLGRQEGS